MYSRPPTIEEAQEEKNQLLERVQNLDAYILAFQKIASNGHGAITNVPSQPVTLEPQSVAPSTYAESTPENGSGSQVMSTAAVAYRVLSAAPRSMRLADVVKGMREAGWEGSGNDKTDQDRAYAAMYRAKEKFVRPKWGRWAIKK